MKKLLIAVGIILSLPVFYVAGPIFLPGKAIAWIYYDAPIRDRYLARHAHDGFFQ